MIGLGNMAVKRYGIELSENFNSIDARIDAVADGDINQAVLTRHGHGRF
jgi:hypothetical protein